MASTGAGRGDRRERAGWPSLISGLQALQAALAGLYDLAIGGLGDLTAHYIAGLTGSPFRSAPNKFFALSAHDALMQVFGNDATVAFADNCAAGLAPNLPKIRAYLEKNLMLVTAQNPHIDYDKAAQIAKKAHHEGLP
ncbi:MAG: hypothetical protein MUO63_01970 [Desulfobulbaceae bacterium]|nr:hypothetical protein [Desulfobulbaceae bacterium]